MNEGIEEQSKQYIRMKKQIFSCSFKKNKANIQMNYDLQTRNSFCLIKRTNFSGNFPEHLVMMALQEG